MSLSTGGGWFHSGDRVRIDDQGYLFVVDRIKDVINTGGMLVASREVEDGLYGCARHSAARRKRSAGPTVPPSPRHYRSVPGATTVS